MFLFIGQQCNMLLAFHQNHLIILLGIRRGIKGHTGINAFLELGHGGQFSGSVFQCWCGSAKLKSDISDNPILKSQFELRVREPLLLRALLTISHICPQQSVQR